ncbi:hypothetical protein [Aquimarina addita]|uniref:hypothetical protein n=1 Tax=Aquimarina addita TaxID=870485 RepID=UPI0031F162AD
MLVIRNLQRLYFPVFGILAIAIYGLQSIQYPLHPILNNYVNDFLCIPIVLWVCLKIIRYLKGNSSLQIPLALQVTVTIIFCLYFEYYLPINNNRYTSDFYDVILYFSGMFFFYFMESTIYFKEECY